MLRNSHALTAEQMQLRCTSHVFCLQKSEYRARLRTSLRAAVDYPVKLSHAHGSLAATQELACEANRSCVLWSLAELDAHDRVLLVQKLLEPVLESECTRKIGRVP